MIPSVILNEDDLREVVQYVLTKDRFAFDVEAQGDNREVPHLANLSWLSLATEGLTVVIPFGHPIGDRQIGTTKVPETYKSGKKIGEIYYKSAPVWEPPPVQLERDVVFRILAPLFASDLIKMGHDVIYDLVAVAKYLGFVPPPPYRCTKVERWLLDENTMHWGLKETVELELGHKYDFENIGACVEKYPFSTVAYYSYCDAKYDYFVDSISFPRIQEENLERVFDVEMGVLNALCGMRLAGARMDMERLQELHDVLTKEVAVCEAEVYRSAGHVFNINSPKQKQVVLYKEQKLKPWKLTKGGMKKPEMIRTFEDYSTDDDVLESYAGNAVVDAIREYGDKAKLLSTYVDSWLGYNGDPLIYDEHLHAGFLQYGTVTGRFSCRKPNLQNIPTPFTEDGRKIRDVFIAEPGGKLIVADYSQIELVVLAHYVGSGKLYEGFQQGIDPHTMTAAMVLGKRPEDITKSERQDLGKTLGFAVVYGAGLGKVANMAKITPQQAKVVLKKHEQMFPEIHGFRDSVISLAKTRRPPYITTLLGRRRRVPMLLSRDDKLRMGAERQTFNSLIQGGAADILKFAMVNLDSMLPEDIKMILTVHDELVLSSPAERAQEAAALLQDAMTGPVTQALVRVPLKADVHICDRWSEAK